MEKYSKEILASRVCERIEAYREKHKNAKIADLAKNRGITSRTLYNAKEGLSMGTAFTLAMLADALETSADYLLGRTDDPTWKNKN